MNKTTQNNILWLEALVKVQRYLRSGERVFAASLAQQYARKKSLSDKQWHWVQKLAERGIDRADEHVLNDIIYNG